VLAILDREGLTDSHECWIHCQETEGGLAKPRAPIAPGHAELGQTAGKTYHDSIYMIKGYVF